MLTSGILNPRLLSLVARVRHTNYLVIADRGFPSWPGLESVDISLVDDIPTVLDVLMAVRAVADYGRAYMAEEFLEANGVPTQDRFREVLYGLDLQFEAHEGAFKERVPRAVGLIRTGDTTPYANVILESA